jgi:hypothetical protein
MFYQEAHLTLSSKVTGGILQQTETQSYIHMSRKQKIFKEKLILNQRNMKEK